jgi:epsilon-lactone hydrolase
MKNLATFLLFTFSLLIFSCNTTKRSSLTGTVARESLRAIMRVPILYNGAMFQSGKVLNEVPSVWKAPKGFRLTKTYVEGLPIELLETTKGSDKIILQLHGGAYIIGYNDFYREIALKYSKMLGGVSVLSIDYRIAPQYTFPAALVDAVIAWNWLLNKGYKPENIIIVGDSAGGNLALALVMKLRDEGCQLPAAMVCMSPWTDMASEGDSYIYNRYNDPMFGEKLPKKGEIVTEREHYRPEYAGNTDLHYKYLSPAYGEYQDFPPMLIQVGTFELLESDAITVYKKAKAANVDATLTRYEQMYHVFQFTIGLPESKQAWEEVMLFIGKHIERG